MAMFINPSAKVPVTLDGNTIYIRAKMDAGTRALVQNEIAATNNVGKDTEITGLGSYSLALLVRNIVDWEGPAFMDEKGQKREVSRANISMLDLDDPLVELVREEIGKRNAPKESPSPN
jgi:hypothetical protein